MLAGLAVPWYTLACLQLLQGCEDSQQPGICKALPPPPPHLIHDPLSGSMDGPLGGDGILHSCRLHSIPSLQLVSPS